jgi:predicted deacetylase
VSSRYFLLFFAVSLAAGPPLAGPVHASAAAPDTLVFIVRVDDILSRSMDHGRTITPFEEVVAARGGKVTWAVIPHRLIESANADGALARELQDTVERGHELSLHGYTHICQRCNQSSHEMYCARDGVAFSYAHQRALVEDGTAILRDQVGMEPTSFVPPGHQMDHTTLRVLADLGYDVVSTTETSHAYLYEGMYNLAPSREYTWALTEGRYRSELTAALRDVRASGGYFNLLHHDPFIRPNYGEGIVLRWTAELLDSLNVEYEGRIRYATLSEAARLYTGGAVAAEPHPVAAGGFRLESVYPNPTADRMTFEIHTEDPGLVEVLIFDVLGRVVGRPSFSADGPGRHDVEWSATDVPSGLYLYRVRQGQALTGGSVVVAK